MMTYKLDDYANTDLKPQCHELLVIGNGFDLACGLSSDFGSFRKSRELAFEKNDENEHDVECIYTRTIWDEILNGKGPNWCDIEGAIADWLAPAGKRPLSSSTLFGKCLKKLKEAIRGVGCTWRHDLLEDAVALCLYQRYKFDKAWDEAELLRVTMEDLHVLEDDFSKYLFGIIDSTPEYKDKASELMLSMMAWGKPGKSGFKVETSILSFNYTRIVQEFRRGNSVAGYTNIHGKLGGEIVFGIDGKDLMDCEEVAPFTKTYRIMALNSAGSASMFKISKGEVPKHEGTTAIKFYGHSLGKADYSYFQAMFDAVGLYEGRTKLVFFFRPHEKNGAMQTSDEAKHDMMKKVIALLVAYGLTLDNAEHGKNLIHKLLIEGRLSVVELPVLVYKEGQRTI